MLGPARGDEVDYDTTSDPGTTPTEEAVPTQDGGKGGAGGAAPSPVGGAAGAAGSSQGTGGAGPGAGGAAPKPVDCSGIQAQPGFELCGSGADYCDGVFTNAEGCVAFCAAAGLLCASRYGGSPNCGGPELNYPLDCASDTGHDSDWCHCAGAAGSGGAGGSGGSG